MGVSPVTQKQAVGKGVQNLIRGLVGGSDERVPRAWGFWKSNLCLWFFPSSESKAQMWDLVPGHCTLVATLSVESELFFLWEWLPFLVGGVQLPMRTQLCRVCG